MKMERNIGSLKDSYMVLAASQQYILLRSKTENPRPSYAVARIDGDGRALPSLFRMLMGGAATPPSPTG